MSSVEWNKKEDLLQDQALRHVKKNIPLFTAFTSNDDEAKTRQAEFKPKVARPNRA